MLKFRRGQSGLIFTASGSATAPSVAIGAVNTGLYSSSAGLLDMTFTGTRGLTFNANGVGILSDGASVGYYFGATSDSSILRVGANALSTGIFGYLTGVVSSAGNISLSATQCLGRLVLITAAGTATLVTVAAGTIGSSLIVYSTTAAAVSVKAAAGDRIVMADGTALDDGDKITNDSTAGSWAYLINDAAEGWRCLSTNGVWTDGGA